MPQIRQLTFHNKTGSLVVLSANNSCAERINATREFNNALVCSSQPLQDNELFQVKVEKKLSSWSGSLEIGLTMCDPENSFLPTSCSEFTSDTWIISGTSVLHRGSSISELYGPDLDKVEEGDIIGIMKSDGVMRLFYNGIDQGPAATELPDEMWAVCDMYGKCSKLSVVTIDHLNLPLSDTHNQNTDLTTMTTVANLQWQNNPSFKKTTTTPWVNAVMTPSVVDSAMSSLSSFKHVITSSIFRNDSQQGEQPSASNNGLQSRSCLTAARIFATSNNNNDNTDDEDEDSITDLDINRTKSENHDNRNEKLQQSTHNPLSSPLLTSVPLVQLDDSDGQSSVTSPHPLFNTSLSYEDEEEEDGCADDSAVKNDAKDMDGALLFDTNCGSLIKLSHDRLTAERDKPMDEFRNGVVVSNRPLKDDEYFEVVIDKLVSKWSGCIEIGIINHHPSTLPSTITNLRPGTIMMSGCGILINGKGSRFSYGMFDLEKLKVGDKIGLMRKSSGNLHFYVNGVDQGVAAHNVYKDAWVVVDLYGMAVQVSITSPLVHAEDRGLLQFHPRCGQHCCLSDSLLTAYRPNATEDFNNAIVLTNRCLMPGEVFQVRLDKLINKWTGSVEIGVTTHRPGSMELPCAMSNDKTGMWVMSGTNVMKDGVVVRKAYGCNLDHLKTGDKVGVVVQEGNLSFLINGVNMGIAARHLPQTLYGVVDLYGQACMVSIVAHDASEATTDPCDMGSLPDDGVENSGDEEYFDGVKSASHSLVWIPQEDFNKNKAFKRHKIKCSNNGSNNNNGNVENDSDDGSDDKTSNTHISNNCHQNSHKQSNTASSHTPHHKRRRKPSHSFISKDRKIAYFKGRNHSTYHHHLQTHHYNHHYSPTMVSKVPMKLETWYDVMYHRIGPEHQSNGTFHFGVLKCEGDEQESCMLKGKDVWLQQASKQAYITHHDYPLDLGKLRSGARLGVQVESGGCVRFMLDGVECGQAALLSLSKGSKIHLHTQTLNRNTCLSLPPFKTLPNITDVIRKEEKKRKVSAIKLMGDASVSNNGQVATCSYSSTSPSYFYSCKPIKNNSSFGIKITMSEESSRQQFKLGLISPLTTTQHLLVNGAEKHHFLLVVEGSNLFINDELYTNEVSPSLEGLVEEDVVGVALMDGCFSLSVNQITAVTCPCYLKKNTHAFIGLGGGIRQISLTSPDVPFNSHDDSSGNSDCYLIDDEEDDDEEEENKEEDTDEKEETVSSDEDGSQVCFLGDNITFENNPHDRIKAPRGNDEKNTVIKNSGNNNDVHLRRGNFCGGGVVVLKAWNDILTINQLQVKIEKMVEKWAGSVRIGVFLNKESYVNQFQLANQIPDLPSRNLQKLFSCYDFNLPSVFLDGSDVIIGGVKKPHSLPITHLNVGDLIKMSLKSGQLEFNVKEEVLRIDLKEMLGKFFDVVCVHPFVDVYGKVIAVKMLSKVEDVSHVKNEGEKSKEKDDGYESKEKSMLNIQPASKDPTPCIHHPPPIHHESSIQPPVVSDPFQCLYFKLCSLLLQLLRLPESSFMPSKASCHCSSCFTSPSKKTCGLHGWVRVPFKYKGGMSSDDKNIAYVCEDIRELRRVVDAGCLSSKGGKMLRSSVIGRNASQKDYSNIEDREKNEEMRREELVVYPSIHHALSMCSQQPFNLKVRSRGMFERLCASIVLEVSLSDGSFSARTNRDLNDKNELIKEQKDQTILESQTKYNFNKNTMVETKTKKFNDSVSSEHADGKKNEKEDRCEWLVKECNAVNIKAFLIRVH